MDMYTLLYLKWITSKEVKEESEKVGLYKGKKGRKGREKRRRE